MEISEKEFAIIREISSSHLPDQRTIANRTGISLGLTNLIIKRLITKGYIKAKQLNRKKIQYMLTPKGFSEKAKKSYNFTLKTIALLRFVQEHIQKLLENEDKNGTREFIIQGSNELADITESLLRNLNKPDIRVYRNSSTEKAIFVTCVNSKDGTKHTTDIIRYLSENGVSF